MTWCHLPQAASSNSWLWDHWCHRPRAVFGSAPSIVESGRWPQLGSWRPFRKCFFFSPPSCWLYERGKLAKECLVPSGEVALKRIQILGSSCFGLLKLVGSVLQKFAPTNLARDSVDFGSHWLLMESPEPCLLSWGVLLNRGLHHAESCPQDRWDERSRQTRSACRSEDLARAVTSYHHQILCDSTLQMELFGMGNAFLTCGLL